jgi:hypothetical protein
MPHEAGAHRRKERLDLEIHSSCDEKGQNEISVLFHTGLGEEKTDFDLLTHCSKGTVAKALLRPRYCSNLPYCSQENSL